MKLKTDVSPIKPIFCVVINWYTDIRIYILRLSNDINNLEIRMFLILIWIGLKMWCLSGIVEGNSTVLVQP